MAQNPVPAFDTHAAVVELMEAGMPKQQAESVVRLHVRPLEQNLATKADIGAVNSTIDSSQQTTKAEFEKVYSAIDSLRHATKADIASLKAELVKWMIGTNLAFAALLIAAIRSL